MRIQTLQVEEVKTFCTFGKSLPRTESYGKVTGKTQYAYDIQVPRMLHAKVKRCPHPHAEVVSIDTTRAERLAGVRAVITGRSHPTRRYGLILADTQVLALERALYAGDAVAAVAAETIEIAEEALDLIDVQYKELPALLDPVESVRPDPPVILHPDLQRYRRAPVKGPKFDPARPNVSNRFRLNVGDVEGAFKRCDLVLERTFKTQSVTHLPLEPNATVAYFDVDGSLVIITSTQSAYRIRQELSDALGIPSQMIRVIVPNVGGGFGNKLSLASEPICALLAKVTGRPVKLAFTRAEAMICTNTRHPFTVRAKAGAGRDGKFVALELDVLIDGGAYSSGPGIYVTGRGVLVALNTYRWPNLKIDSSRAYTNKPPGGAFRGFGDTQVGFALESLIDMMAEELKLDPIDLRKRNLLGEGELNGIGEEMHAVASGECLDEVAKVAGWTSPASRPHQASGPWRRGRGVAMAEKHSMGRTTSTAVVQVRADETITLLTSAIEIGCGAHTVLMQIAAEEFGTSIDKVKLHPVDTLDTPTDEGAYTSRQTFNSGNAVRAACLDAKRKIFESAAVKLQTSSTDLEVSDGLIYVRGDRSRNLRIGDLFNRGVSRFGSFLDNGEFFFGQGLYQLRSGELNEETGRLSTTRSETFHQHSAAIVDVSVNIETGQLRTERMIVSADVGRAVNPLLLEGQIEGGVAMGLSACTTEELIHVDGRPSNAELADYKVLGIKDAPEILPLVVEVPQTDGPFGAKGGGEVFIAAVAPAVASAIFDAVGVRITELPMTAEKLHQAMKAANVGRDASSPL